MLWNQFGKEKVGLEKNGPFSRTILLREDIQTIKTFQFGHCPNYPNPPPPIRATLPTFSGRQKRRFARMAEKNTDDDNNCCHDNFDQNFGYFDDNYDKKYWKIYKYC